MKYFVLTTLMFIAGIALTRIEREPHTFTPVVRVRTANGLFFTLLQHEVPTKSSCTTAVEGMVGGFDNTCPTCTVESVECATKLEGIEAALARRKPVPLYVVSSDEIRIGILGPPASVQAQCEKMATVMHNGGVKSATCLPPSGPS